MESSTGYHRADSVKKQLNLGRTQQYYHAEQHIETSVCFLECCGHVVKKIVVGI